MADRLGDRRQTRSRSRIVDETPGSTNQTVEPDQDPENSPVIRGRRSSRRTSNQANIRDSSKSDSKSKSKREKRSRTSNSQGEPGPSTESSDTSRTTKSRRVRFVSRITTGHFMYVGWGPFIFVSQGIVPNCFRANRLIGFYLTETIR